MAPQRKARQSNVQQNIEQLQTPTMGVTINNKSTTTELPPYNGQQPKALGDLNAFYWYQIFALDSAVVEVQEMLRSHGNLLTIAMYRHGREEDRDNILKEQLWKSLRIERLKMQPELNLKQLKVSNY